MPEAAMKWACMIQTRGVQAKPTPEHWYEQGGDKGRIGLYTKLCDFTLLFMILQVELRLNKDH